MTSNTEDLSETTLLQQMLDMVVDNPKPQVCVPFVLQSACAIIGAKAAFYMVFDEPFLIVVEGMAEADIPEVMEVELAAKGLKPGVVFKPTMPAALKGDWLAVPIYIRQRCVGGMWLSVPDGYTLTDADTEKLNILGKGLTAITRNNKVLARHERLSRNQHEFTRIVSHDLRSPLTSMKGFASMLESQMVGELNEKQAHFIDKILAGIAQMTSLVENIQDAGRYDPETGFYELERSQCDVIEIARRIVSNHLVPAEKQELTLSFNTADDIPIIFADITMLERAITNLVDNAIKYTPNGGTIEVGVERREDMIVVSVTDTGFGISKEDQKRLFDRHTRIRRQEHKRVKGSGLGLFIVRSVAQHHKGHAWVESTEGNGSKFCFSIPLEDENLRASDGKTTE